MVQLPRAVLEDGLADLVRAEAAGLVEVADLGAAGVEVAELTDAGRRFTHEAALAAVERPTGFEGPRRFVDRGLVAGEAGVPVHPVVVGGALLVRGAGVGLERVAVPVAQIDRAVRVPAGAIAVRALRIILGSRAVFRARTDVVHRVHVQADRVLVAGVHALGTVEGAALIPGTTAGPADDL